MNAPVKPCMLAAWRLRHAKLTQAEAADRAGIPLQHASAIESNPSRATVGALASYVAACGGRLECFVEIGGARRLLVLLALLVACGAPAPSPLEPPPGFCVSYRCEPEVTTFAPSPALAAGVEVVLRRLRKVTGRDDLRIDPAGVPIEHAEDLRIVEPDTDGKTRAACGLTTVAGWENDGAASPIGYTQRIQLDPTPPVGCPRGLVPLMHEFIHALAPHAQHVDGPSLFAATAHGARFDEAAVTALCGEFACREFAPETGAAP